MPKVCSQCSRPADRVDRKLCSVCREKSRRNMAEQRRRHPQQTVDSRINSRRRLNKKVIDHYGGKCVCCSESTLVFLTLDHKENDGAEHRRQLSSSAGSRMSSYSFYAWVRDSNYPIDLQVLCWNCQWGKQKNGICPHQEV